MKHMSLTHKSLPLGIMAALGGFVLALATTGLAEAQYYPPGGGYYRSAPPPDYYPAPRYRPRPRYDEDYYPAPRRRAFGSVCVTSRGSCSIGRPVPLPAGCICHIPGFGRKRGAVQ